jgi:hypothetical protein
MHDSDSTVKKILLILCLLGGAKLVQATDTIPPLPPPKPKVRPEPPLYLVFPMPVLSVGHQMPVSKAEKHQFARGYFSDLVNRFFVLPEEAKAVDISGEVVISFIINKAQYITEIKIEKDIGFGIGEALVAAIDGIGARKVDYCCRSSRVRPVRVYVKKHISFQKKGEEVTIEVRDKLEEQYMILTVPIFKNGYNHDKHFIAYRFDAASTSEIIIADHAYAVLSVDNIPKDWSLLGVFYFTKPLSEMPVEKIPNDVRSLILQKREWPRKYGVLRLEDRAGKIKVLFVE